MKKIRTIVSACLVALSVVGINPVKANASTRWIKDNTGWWYQMDSTWAVGWKLIDGKWYFFDSNGYMKHDCYEGVYYLGSDGAWAEPSAEEKTADPNKKLSSGLTLFEAAQKIQSTINNLKFLGETVDANMDYINQQCENLGTTYQEVSKLPVDVMNQTESKKTETVYQAQQQTTTKQETPAKQPAQTQQSTSNYNFSSVGDKGAGSNSSSVQTQAQPQSKPQSSTQQSSGNMSLDEMMKQWLESNKSGFNSANGVTSTWNPEADAAANRNNN